MPVNNHFSVLLFFLFSLSHQQIYDILVVNQNYDGDGTSSSLSLRRGDLIEVLDMTSNNAENNETNKNSAK